jgi:hypothetical protein
VGVETGVAPADEGDWSAGTVVAVADELGTLVAGAHAESTRASRRTVFTGPSTHEEGRRYRPPRGDRSGYPRM